MALIEFPNKRGVLFIALYGIPYGSFPNTQSNVINAVGESIAFIGRLYLESGPGTSKVFSSAGAKIYARAASVTFANGSTNFRAGIQDVSLTTGLEDGTYDVQGNFTGGGGGVANGMNEWAMGSGTKTITHGDLIAVVLELTARGGADSIGIVTPAVGVTGNLIFPYCTTDTGGGPVKIKTLPQVITESDDGTLGWFGSESWAGGALQIASFNVDSTPDEYALVFEIPYKIEINALNGIITIGASAAAELILYSDPLGTPVAERVITIDPDVVAGTSFGLFEEQITAYELQASTKYAIALRPTTTNNVAITGPTFGSGNGHLRRVTIWGTNASLYTRTGNTGAFGSEDTENIPALGFMANKIDNGAGGGGGLNLYAIE